MCEEEGQALVVHSGSEWVQAGFAGDDAPRCVFPSVVGRDKYGSPKLGKRRKTRQVWVGDEALTRRKILELKSPIEIAKYPIKIVTDWDAMEKIWHHIFFNELRRLPEQVN